MKRNLWIWLAWLVSTATVAQDHPGNLLHNAATGCGVWLKHTFEEDSIAWTGGCKNKLAWGMGTLSGFTKGQLTMTYTGQMQNGRMHGQGSFSFWGDRKLVGNFVNGEPLFLPDSLWPYLHKNVVSETDPTQAYDGDNAQTQLYYHALVPPGQLMGTVVLMPGTWDTTEHVLSSMSTFCSLAFQQRIAVLVLSINQRLTLTDSSIQLINAMCTHAIQTYNLPKAKFVLGGWSMGGLFSLRYTELSRQDSSKTVIHPLAVFSCDGPCDLKTIYHNFKRKLHKNPGQNEPAYGMKEMEKHCGGPPEIAAPMYTYYSPYSHGDPYGGNARYLTTTPVRIYADVDPVWWMQNRHVDMYDLNALDQTAMIQLLNDSGNKRAEFINAFQKRVQNRRKQTPALVVYS